MRDATDCSLAGDPDSVGSCYAGKRGGAVEGVADAVTVGRDVLEALARLEAADDATAAAEPSCQRQARAARAAIDGLD